MRNPGVVREVSWQTAQEIMKVFPEKRESFIAVLIAVQAGIETYQIQEAPLEQRLRPSAN